MATNSTPYSLHYHMHRSRDNYPAFRPAQGQDLYLHRSLNIFKINIPIDLGTCRYVGNIVFNVL